MAEGQLPDPMSEFASYLDGLLARLDPGGGWSGVFWQRDPEGMRACLEGCEVPPWDVVEALLRDLGAAYGAAAAAAERERARTLHRAALTAYDARPGARDALADRLDVMLREQRYAAERQAELSRLLSTPVSAEEAELLRVDLAWARDDHGRATARCAELRDRLAALHRRPADVPGPRGVGAQVARRAGGAGAPPPTAAPAEPRRRRRGGARFAGMAESDTAPLVVPQAPVPAQDVADGRRTPRGARFAGGVAEGEPERAAGAVGADRVGGGAEGETEEAAREAVGRAVARLGRLRAEGRSGEAHTLLVEVTQWPAARFPLLADALHRAGLGADWATLLWEAASLPAERVVAAAGALASAGRQEDGRQMLRQGVARPPERIGAAVLRLDGAGRRDEVRTLLDAYVRVRAPEEAARSAAADPRRLVPLLLEAARAVSDERHWDLVHALRVAGHAT
ncbi:hypothetical protein ACIHEJ_09960 [Streptomyces sp. NPDC052301]|uniref:hypothetical protein n=1 Tax=Streptomyces sp. NPDC052301 TaxID=3365687 RepID=UPI0037D90C3B